MSLLSLKNLAIKADKKQIISRLNLEIQPGEIHIIMGPNGSGKSTLCNALMGHPHYQITSGSAQFADKNLLTLKTNQRATAGLFLAFQYPREIPGVSLSNVLRTAKNIHNEAAKQPRLKRTEFAKQTKAALTTMGLEANFLSRSLNENASGGEKKRLEMVQLAILKPKLAILDEIDSGVDIDALQAIAAAIEKQRATDNTAFLIVTHYQRLLGYLKPDRVHVMVDGQIVKSGSAELAQELEKTGYQGFKPAK
ncbi:MAG: Fe-S cluster assembly ATPase SufC [Candidatus Kerfeldbacteria bacterium RIFCSPHIGHO2_12_FULL_48_17]|uniref:Fe-S cluster assembly ATPase SufC n=1 Tax=Candidatus Kerfeldbacteria bacterium RIFCSPHIGHO2_12_FULL_48_17 TaxID=1798542 RepID=A0A1G2AXI5_9BACT|nr:MAG: Fe-S cluster assembly ATPase SufC [Candidatus Kerfeldbacteria bacterium RIFCSPHIGHO2_12_FULL_48_17]